MRWGGFCEEDKLGWVQRVLGLELAGGFQGEDTTG
jgi:hypothetical protein